jgi:UDP-glucose:(heptosyl)LPS alpha-1,3-glucosyltransferase
MNYLPTKGGLERYTISLSSELLQIGHQVHVFANRWERRPGIIFHHVPMVRFSSPGKNLSFAYFSKRELSKEKFDVIQSMERIFYQDIFRVSDGINPVQMIQRYTNPLVRQFKALGPRRLALSYLERRIFKTGGCKVILAISQIIKREIIAHYGVDPHKIEVIYNGVDTSKFHPGVKEKHGMIIREKYGIKPDELVLLFISNDHKRKNLQSVLEAMRRLKDKRFRLMAVGDDNNTPYIKWAARSGIGEQILFTGPQRNIERYFGAADIFVFPTNYDAFGSACLEAMACGLPVIASRTCGASELIRDGENGFIISADAPEGLADRIAALQPVSRRVGIGRKAAETAARYTVQKHLAEIQILYERVINGRFS